MMELKPSGGTANEGRRLWCSKNLRQRDFKLVFRGPKGSAKSCMWEYFGFEDSDEGSRHVTCKKVTSCLGATPQTYLSAQSRHMHTQPSITDSSSRKLGEAQDANCCNLIFFSKRNEPDSCSRGRGIVAPFHQIGSAKYAPTVFCFML